MLLPVHAPAPPLTPPSSPLCRLPLLLLLLATVGSKLAPVCGEAWPKHHVKRIGDELQLRCPTTDKTFKVEWEKGGHRGGPPPNMTKVRVQTFYPLEFGHTGVYSCFDNSKTGNESSFVQYNTRVLVVDFHCNKIKDSPQVVRCLVQHLGDDRNELEIMTICDPNDLDGKAVGSNSWTRDDLVVSRELVIRSSEQRCLFMLKYHAASLRMWPISNYQRANCDAMPGLDYRMPTNYNVVLVVPVCLVAVILVLSVTLAGLVTIMNKKLKVTYETKKTNEGCYVPFSLSPISSPYQSIVENSSLTYDLAHGISGHAMA